jgi:biotin synthase-related radical SAM superfamily protein
MSFDSVGRVIDYGIADSELDEVIDAGIAFRTSGCPGKFAEDVSACDRPYGDSPPSTSPVTRSNPTKDIARSAGSANVRQELSP